MHIARAVAALCPAMNAETVAAWAAALGKPMADAEMNTPRRAAAFLGQCSEESGFSHVEEDLYYLSAERIFRTWPDSFYSQNEARPYVGEPEMLANRVYAGRMGNGDEASGDGWRYRGRGLIQVTGRSLYEMLVTADGRAADPDWLAKPEGAAYSACWWWSLPSGDLRTLNALADVWALRAITLRVNGGTAGVDARVAASEVALRALLSAPEEAPIAVAAAAPPPVAPAHEITADELNAESLAGTLPAEEHA